MSVRIVGDTDEPKAALYDSTDGIAFGPTFDTVSDADDFLEYLGNKTDTDIQMLSDDELKQYHLDWRVARDA